MPEAGWYEDPHNPNQQRYWDGSTWTEHTHDAPFHMPQAPNQGQGEQYGAPVGRPGYINDIGDWLSRSFSVLFSNAMPLFILLLLGIAASLVPYWAVTRVARDVIINFEGFDADSLPTGVSVSGVSGGLVALAIVAMIVGSLFAALMTLAQSFLLHRGHVNQPSSLGDALSAGVKGLLRYAGWWIAIILGVVAAMLLVIVLVSFLGAVSGALAGLVGFVFVVAIIPVAIWLWVKISFLSVSCAVAPQGESALKASTERSRSRFWGVFGRLLLIAIITAVVNGIIQSFASPTIIQGVGFETGGSFTVNGVPFDELEELRLGDILTFKSTLVLASIISGLLAGAVGLYSRSGLAGLYADLSGPSEHSADS